MSGYKVEDNSSKGVGPVVQMLKHFFPYAQQQLGFHKPVMISFQSDEENANKLLGKTAYYNPEDFSIAVYVDGRHPKDVLRSLSHELVHHTQNCNGDFEATENLGLGYAQEDGPMRAAELDAYKRGNIIFRDFEDLIKKGKIKVNINFEETGEPKMSLKEWKDTELNMLLMKKWGLLKEAAKPDFLDLDKDGDKEESMKSASEDLKEDSGEEEKRHAERNVAADKKHIKDLEKDEEYEKEKEKLEEERPIFAPNHYCVHHGGVQHEGAVKMAEAINHNFNKDLNKVTHYDMRLEDGTVLKGISADDIMVTDASLAEGHGHSMARAEDDEDEDLKDEGVANVGGMGYRNEDESKEHDDEEGNRPSFARKMGLKKETLTLDEARDLARRIFEKLT